MPSVLHSLFLLSYSVELPVRYINSNFLYRERLRDEHLRRRLTNQVKEFYGENECVTSLNQIFMHIVLRDSPADGDSVFIIA